VHQIPMNSLRHEKMRSEFAKVGLGPEDDRPRRANSRFGTARCDSINICRRLLSYGRCSRRIGKTGRITLEVKGTGFGRRSTVMPEVWWTW